MKTRIVNSHGRISLVIDEPDRPAAQRDVVAAMTLESICGIGRDPQSAPPVPTNG